MRSETIKRNGIRSAGGILDRIIEKRIERIEEAKQRLSLEELIDRCEPLPFTRPSFFEALSRRDSVNIIAEIKRQSPSKGIIREDFDHQVIANQYARAGAAAMSVLTEEDFFGGSLNYLIEISQQGNTPLLRKDFIVDDYQLYEARLAGASAVLLIAAVLNDEWLSYLIHRTKSLQMDALVEVHTVDEMRRAAEAGAALIGVNNRDLTTFDVSLETSVELAPLAPPDALLVSESGISTGDDICYLRAAGYQAFLIGEHFMRQANPDAALQKLIEDANRCNESK